jgi:hypothetical protein
VPAYLSRAAVLLALSACTGADPTPRPPAATATYTDEQGVRTALSTISAALVVESPPSTAPGLPPVTAYAVRFTTQLPTGRPLSVSFPFADPALPGPGPVTLFPFLLVRAAGTAPGTFLEYRAPVAAGTLRVEAGAPRAVSATYAGPLEAGGPSVRLELDHVPVP